jgi:crotonobetainyl-CoA:carnitine CoA-transferase CaiB-like acyl-CoA transferase
LTLDIFFRAEWGDGKYPQVLLIADFLTGKVTYLIIEAPEAVKERVGKGGIIDRPLAIPALVLDECLNEWKRQIKDHREELLSYV